MQVSLITNSFTMSRSSLPPTCLISFPHTSFRFLFFQRPCLLIASPTAGTSGGVIKPRHPLQNPSEGKRLFNSALIEAMASRGAGRCRTPREGKREESETSRSKEPKSRQHTPSFVEKRASLREPGIIGFRRALMIVYSSFGER